MISSYQRTERDRFQEPKAFSLSRDVSMSRCHALFAIDDDDIDGGTSTEARRSLNIGTWASLVALRFGASYSHAFTQ